MSLCSYTRKRKEEKKAGVKATENTAMTRQTTVSPSQERLPGPAWSNPFFESLFNNNVICHILTYITTKKKTSVLDEKLHREILNFLDKERATDFPFLSP